jgi:hypothetical protein
MTNGYRSKLSSNQYLPFYLLFTKPSSCLSTIIQSLNLFIINQSSRTHDSTSDLNHQATRSSSHTDKSRRSNGNYPKFHVHPQYYDTIFVNNSTSTNMMKKLLIHGNLYKQYSIDTESDRRNNQLSLIQINSMSAEQKSTVMLFELNHFPDQNSQKYENIHQLFQLIFRSGNEIYS